MNNNHSHSLSPISNKNPDEQKKSDGKKYLFILNINN
jgi:hypothetical protein